MTSRGNAGSRDVPVFLPLSHITEKKGWGAEAGCCNAAALVCSGNPTYLFAG